MKRYLLTAAALAVCASISFSAAAPGSAQTEEAVDYVTAQGIMQGDENGNLNLNDGITRAQAAKMLVEALKIPLTDSDKPTFKDVGKDAWEYKYVETAAANDLINGFEDGTFRPNEAVTYEQAVKMFMGTNPYTEYPTGYISYALDYALLDEIDAILGENMSRGEVAQLIYNIVTALQNGFTPDYSYSGLRIMDNGLESDTESDEAAFDMSVQQSAPMLGSSALNANKHSAASGGGSGGGSSGSSSNSVMSGGVVTESESTIGGGMFFNPYWSSESYDNSLDENGFRQTKLSPLSTFSIDTDTASYSNLRRLTLNAQKIHDGAVRSEELINYFDYDLPQPSDGTPFSVTSEVADCPWNGENKLAFIGVQGEELQERKPQNLVLLIDVSGSMYSYNKLPLVKRAMEMLCENLNEEDRVSIVTYASGTNVVLSGASGSEKDKIVSAITSLQAGGATNGAGGLQLAYEQAQKYKNDGNNRVILCTDGDFNVGISDKQELKDFVSEKRKSGVFLSVLGFGMGNYKDDRLEILADNGNGSYYYIDNLREAKKVFADELTSTLYTIAKDVKIQVEFNPVTVSAYRLIGYENRMLNAEDFADDTKDAGELGAGTSVVALYELVLADGGEAVSGNDDTLRYQTGVYSMSDELMDVKLRYKKPSEDESILKEYPVKGEFALNTSDNFRFAAAVAELGMILNESEFKGSSSYDSVIELARNALGDDKFGIRHEFVQLADILRYRTSRWQ